MTKGPTPTQPPKNEAEYARKLALAILSTLESKGLLSRLDVDTILHAAHRAAQAPAPAAAPAAQTPVLPGSLAQPAQATAPRVPTPATISAEPAVTPDRLPVQPGTAHPDTGQTKLSGQTEPSGVQAATAPARSGPIGPAVLGTRWVKPGGGAAAVTGTDQSEAAIVAAQYEVLSAFPSEVKSESGSEPSEGPAGTKLLPPEAVSEAKSAAQTAVKAEASAPQPTPAQVPQSSNSQSNNSQSNNPQPSHPQPVTPPVIDFRLD